MVSPPPPLIWNIPKTKLSCHILPCIASTCRTCLHRLGLGLQLDPPVHQVAIKWWLDMDTSQGSHVHYALDPLGHPATTCKCGGDVGCMWWHDTFVMFWLKRAIERILMSRWNYKLVMTSRPTIAPPVLLTFY